MKHLKSHTDEALVVLLNNDDERAFLEIYDRYKDELATHLVRLLHAAELAEEVLQDVFMMLWEKRYEMDASKSVPAYLYRSAINKSKNIFRKIANDNRLREEFLTYFRTANNNIVEEWMENKEIQQLLQTLLDRLPPQQKKVYMLCKLDGLSYKEVSEKLKISITTVNSHIRNANIFLKGELKNQSELSGFLYIILILLVF
ncbi:sigma-70 family RNA polymerase sigma factor [Sphingobacterium phlebotomi]|uniref:Sigma-70 family RNA polymerase sigma factor n=1 Tax=Sphingobacterium phlebotomi TaxID=2605433 RepID=A0A5D4HGC0_9SPHI|nr:sigma-70 family RNA polymerase sigma factor [Sphingobacterium phlebotomi]TYR37870.1 sigma-70 family RNA polymerase sigma factor [Sphingobacterium phlebotomi]